MNPDQEALHAQAQALLRRQQQTLQNINDELAFSQNKLREMSRLRDNLYARLFPTMRAGRDTQDVMEQLERHVAESKELQQAIAKQEAELCVLEAERLTSDTATRFVRGRDNLLKLRCRLQVANTNVENTRNLLSPIRVLPPEVLGCIFSYSEETRISSDEPIPDMLSITHVCSSWRSMAINTPSLWSCVRVIVEDGTKKKELPSLIQLWLERSKSHPLMFKLRENARLDSNPTTDSDFFRILDLYLPHIQRWRSVSLTNPRFSVPGWHWFNKIPEEVSCPLLESFSIKCYVLEPDDLSQIEKLTGRSPRLRRVTWRYNSDPGFPDFPWAQLTHLDLVSLIDLEQALHILSSASNLVSADLTIQADPSMADATLPHIVHKNLKALALGISGDLAVLLDFLTLPNLTELSVDILPTMVIMVTLGGSNAGWKQDNFIAFLQRSQCKLEEVSFLDVKLEPHELIAMMRCLSSSLVQITIENLKSPCVTDEVLKVLTYPSTPPPPTSTEGGPFTQGMTVDESSVFCPHLESIRFWGCIESTAGVLADMVESRLYIPEGSTDLTKLHTACFAIHPARNKRQDAERLRAMRDKAQEVNYATLEPDEY